MVKGKITEKLKINPKIINKLNKDNKITINFDNNLTNTYPFLNKAFFLIGLVTDL